MVDVVLKGELHTSPADLEEAKGLLLDGVDVLVLEGSATPRSAAELTSGWFALSVASLFWVLDSVYVSHELLEELATAQGTEIIYTRQSDSAIADNVSFPVKALAGVAFYLLIPASIWTGFITGSQVFGAYLLFLGLVMPVGIVRTFDSRGRQDNREGYIADEIRRACARDATVLAVVGAAHLDGVRARLPGYLDVAVHPPSYGIWTVAHVRQITLPMFKAGLILFSIYLLAVWISVRAVDAISPTVEAVLS